MPFQFALANAFTICDANHCSFLGGTAPNRTFQWSGSEHTHDDPPLPAVYNGPAVENSYGGTIETGYSWSTYAAPRGCRRLVAHLTEPADRRTG
ncbi:MAG: alkaline phosphatase family protein [Burkholderiaceae bacterium]